jgi:hypothetical protein
MCLWKFVGSWHICFNVHISGVGAAVGCSVYLVSCLPRGRKYALLHRSVRRGYSQCDSSNWTTLATLLWPIQPKRPRLTCQESQDSSVITVTGQGAGRPRNRSSIPGGGGTFFCSPTRHQLWSPRSPLVTGC